MSMRLYVALTAGMLLQGAAAIDAQTCQPFDRAPACCPHPPPACCPPEVARPVDDDVVIATCGPRTPKGQSVMLGECRQYYASGDALGEVLFGRQPGDQAAFDKLRGQLTSPRGKSSVITVAGAKSAFLIRDVDERGTLERAAAWALVDAEIIHVEAEIAACTAPQVQSMLALAIGRLHDEKTMNKPTVSRRPN